MAMEKEFLAMRKIDRAFESLDEGQRARVVAWASDKFTPVTPVVQTYNQPIQQGMPVHYQTPH